jgi:hypothetical protein
MQYGAPAPAAAGGWTSRFCRAPVAMRYARTCSSLRTAESVWACRRSGRLGVKWKGSLVHAQQRRRAPPGSGRPAGERAHALGRRLSHRALSSCSRAGAENMASRQRPRPLGPVLRERRGGGSREHPRASGSHLAGSGGEGAHGRTLAPPPVLARLRAAWGGVVGGVRGNVGTRNLTGFPPGRRGGLLPPAQP